MLRNAVLRRIATCLLLCSAACGGACPEPATQANACDAKSVPVGRWTGDWESYPLDNPNFVRSGSLDLVVSAGGSITGHTVEEEGLHRGRISGAVRASGELDAEYAVSREGQTRRYALRGSFVCGPKGLGGKGVVSWEAKQQGNLEFELHRAP
jgi:hypothetical protein